MKREDKPEVIDLTQHRKAAQERARAEAQARAKAEKMARRTSGGRQPLLGGRRHAGLILLAAAALFAGYILLQMG